MYSAVSDPFLFNSFLMSWYHQQLQHSVVHPLLSSSTSPPWPAHAAPTQQHCDAGSNSSRNLLTSSDQFLTAMHQHQYSLGRLRDMSIPNDRTPASHRIADVTGIEDDGGRTVRTRKDAAQAKGTCGTAPRKFDFRRLAESVTQADIPRDTENKDDDVRKFENDAQVAMAAVFGDYVTSRTESAAATAEDASRLYLQWPLSASLPVQPALHSHRSQSTESAL